MLFDPGSKFIHTFSLIENVHKASDMSTRWILSQTSTRIENTFMHNKTSIVHWIKNLLRRTCEHNPKYNYPSFSFFSLKKGFFIDFKSFKINTGCNPIDFYVIFSMQSSVFITSLNFRSISLKTEKKT